MSRAVWHKGPPPSVGWWPASNRRISGIYRWWDGVSWSMPAVKSDRNEAVALLAMKTSSFLAEIEWRDRPKSWPARSRT